MVDLEALWLDTTDVTDAGLAAIADLQNLELLDLRNTLISDAGVTHLSSFPRLQELNLSCCRDLTNAGMAALAACPRLPWLNLDATAVDAGAISHLIQLPFTFLSLTWTDVDSTAVEFIEQFDALKELHIMGTRIEPACVESFCTARADCVVHFSQDLSL